MFFRGTFHCQANPELETLDLSFNHIQRIEYDTFRKAVMGRRGKAVAIEEGQIQKRRQRRFLLFFKSSYCKTASAARNSINAVPQALT